MASARAAVMPRKCEYLMIHPPLSRITRPQRTRCTPPGRSGGCKAHTFARCECGVGLPGKIKNPFSATRRGRERDGKQWGETRAFSSLDGLGDVTMGWV